MKDIYTQKKVKLTEHDAVSEVESSVAAPLNVPEQRDQMARNPMRLGTAEHVFLGTTAEHVTESGQHFPPERPERGSSLLKELDVRDKVHIYEIP